ncbi:MAG: PDDEXK nuclease domain-containing protein [Candidatus Aminicenantes bacterium]|nr:PDDEXK nuclease domain-containing protein [Candidatus Aminicenantes bacterium]
MNNDEKQVSKKQDSYLHLLDTIGQAFMDARRRAIGMVHNEQVRAYWNIGRHIVEYEQDGIPKAEYGTALLERLADDLRKRHGHGFSRSNVSYMRLFYVKYPICETLSHKLTWSHYFELLKISNDLERFFYEKQCISENWSVRDLKRQKKTALFLRLMHNNDKEKLMKISRNGQELEHPEDLLKDPYIFEFLGISEDIKPLESDLERRIISNLQQFLLELGKGFAFIARQHRITIANVHYRVDLVFYHRILKCFVLIDLKVNEVEHNDIGQMNMYLNYFKEEESAKDDNEPIGIILATDKDEILVKYATGGLSRKIFVSRYQTYLPDRKLLEERIKTLMEAEGAIP